MQPNNSKYLPKRNENTCLHKDLYMNVHSSIIYSSQKLEAIDMSIVRWIEKQNVVYPYNGIRLNNEKEQTTGTCNMDEPQKHSKWKKPGTKDYFIIPFIWNI